MIVVGVDRVENDRVDRDAAPWGDEPSFDVTQLGSSINFLLLAKCYYRPTYPMGMAEGQDESGWASDQSNSLP